MGAHEIDDYCSYTKAVEFLGDRWCLLLIRQLVMFGPQGFNDLAAGIPGHVSRSVLMERLHRLGDIGFVSRAAGSRGRLAPYKLTDAGMAFVPTVMSLRGWAEAWLPTDPAMVERDPTIVMVWLGERIDRGALPERQAVIQLTMRHNPPIQGWLIIESGTEPLGCLEDPMLDDARYVYIESSIPAIAALAQGQRDFAAAIADGSIEVLGDPALVAAFPTWFRLAEPMPVPSPASGMPEESPALVG